MNEILFTLLILSIFKGGEILINRISANQNKKGELKAQILFEPEIKKLLNEVDEMFNVKIEHLKGYIDAVSSPNF